MAYKSVLLVVLCLTVVSFGQIPEASAQDVASQPGIMDSVIESINSFAGMDLRDAISSAFTTILNYFTTTTPRVGQETSRASLEGDIFFDLIEQSPTLHHYALLAHDYMVSFNHFFP